jgi:hypothetical protein
MAKGVNGYSGKSGSGGSTRGRYYYATPCRKCGRPIPRNVLPQHERRCQVTTPTKTETA